MHKAAVKGHLAACRYLVEEAGLGGQHMRADGDGNTPADMARLVGHGECAAWLEAAAQHCKKQRVS